MLGDTLWMIAKDSSSIARAKVKTIKKMSNDQ